MNSARTCPQCGTPLPGGAADWLCPRCLLRQAGSVGLQDELAATSAPSELGLPSKGLTFSGESQAILHRFGDYELLEEIARGGMGVVYRARQVSLDRVVAVKMILSAPFANEANVKRFRAEAQMAASLRHPHIVGIYEVGEYEGQHYFSMEYVEGQNLAELVRNNPLPPKRAAELVRAVAEGVHYAHQHGVLHRDLKPSNVLIDAEGQPRLTDFGLAKNLKGDSELTLTGQALGSPSYISPEQAAARHGEVGPPSDVYSLGAILYHLLTGRAPFAAETIGETLRQVTNNEPASPRLLNPALSRDLETICLKCLHKEPLCRYGTALALAQDLTRWLQAKPIQARPVSPAERLGRWCRRNPALATLASSVALLLVALALGSAIAAIKIQKAKLEALDKLRASYLDQAHAARLGDEAGHRFHTLEIVAKAAAMNPPPAMRDALRREAIAAMALVDLRPAKTWEITNIQGGSVRFDSRMELYARPADRTNITVRRIQDDAEIALLPGSGPVGWIHFFSRDSRYLACLQSQTEYWIWDILERRIVVRLPLHHEFDISPDSRTLAVSSPEGQLSLQDLSTGEVRRRFPVGHVFRHLQFHPNGTQLAGVVEDSTNLIFLDLQTAKPIREFSAPSPLGRLTWAPAGDWLAAGSEGGRVFIWNSQTGERHEIRSPHGELVVCVGFDHAGTLVASAGWDGVVQLSDLFTGRLLVSHPGFDYQIDFSPDDRLLAFVGDYYRFSLLEATVPSEFRVLRVAQSELKAWSLEFAAQGRVLLVGEDGGVRGYEMATGQALGFLPVRDPRSILVRADDKELIVCGDEGLKRWPLEIHLEGKGHTIVFGEREQLLAGRGFKQASLDAAGRRIAVASVTPGEAVVMDLAVPGTIVAIKPHSSMQSICLSPKGDFVATGTWGGTSVRIWEAATGKQVANLHTDFGALVSFSPDGHWLAVDSQNDWLYEVGSWKLGVRLRSVQQEGAINNLAFSPDARILAMGSRFQGVHLLSVATGQVLAALEAPSPGSIDCLRFSPDGSKLAVLLNNRDVQVWDLRLIRQRLAAMGLDWEDPAPQPQPSALPPQPR